MNISKDFKSNKNFDFSLDDNILDERESFSPKVKVIYFSPTGTTKRIIKNVIKELSQKKYIIFDFNKGK